MAAVARARSRRFAVLRGGGFAAFGAFAIGALAALAVGCVDPVTDDAVAALGEEAPGVRPGPIHRPGQPCLTCHGDTGPGSPKMAVGGTVFTSPQDGSPGQPGVTVRLTDATGRIEERITNSVGNFYVFVEEWEPVWPLRAELEKGGIKTPMKSLINGRVGCATCHRGQGATSRSLPRLSFGGGS
jgi:hypothetical protein